MSICDWFMWDDRRHKIQELKKKQEALENVWLYKESVKPLNKFRIIQFTNRFEVERMTRIKRSGDTTIIYEWLCTGHYKTLKAAEAAVRKIQLETGIIVKCL